MTKMTNKIALDIAMTALMNDANAEFRIAGTDVTFSKQEAMDKLAKMMEQLDKKANAEKKPTQKQMENAQIVEHIYDAMLANGGALTISDIQSLDEEFGTLSNQKVAALVRQLVSAQKVERIEEKRKAYFKAIA